MNIPEAHLLTYFHMEAKKMANILQMTFWNAFISMNENLWSTNEISLRYVLLGLIDSTSVLVQAIAWWWIDYKPLPERTMFQFSDAYIPHQGPFINSSSPGQNGHHFTNDIFKCIFFNEKVRFFIKISLKLVL